jgi:hypothetical protein
MGQQVFIPRGGNNSGENAIFLSQLYDAGAYVDYGLPLPAGGAGVFYTTGFNYCIFVAFRVVQENTLAENIPILTVSDAASNGWRFFINSNNKVCARADAVDFIPDTCNTPLGRVVIATLDVEVNGGELYLHGRQVATVALPDTVSSVAPVTLVLGGGGSWTQDFIEYVGFGFINKFLSSEEVAEAAIASQDAGRIVFPASVVGSAPFATPFVIYNASSGLADPAVWVPSQNTLGAPNLPAIPNGIPVGTLLRAPFYVAHSGWADVPVP